MSMFPTPFTGSGGNDPNRSWREKPSPDGTWPTSLRYGFVLTIVAAILMLVTGMVMLTHGEIRGEDAPLDVIASYESNLRIVAIGNIVLALLLTAAASYLRRGSVVGRRWLGVGLFISAFLNIAGFIVSVVGLASIVIVVLVAFAGMFAFRPAANEFVRETTWDRVRRDTQE